MSTEGMNLDQAVEAFMTPEESVQEVSENDTIEESPEADYAPADEVETEEDSEVEYSEEEYSEEDDTEEESTEYEDDEPDQSEPSTIRVKVDGEEVDVTLDDLKRSYSGQGKIQKGMQEAAEMRKQAQAQAQQVAQAAQAIQAMYQKVQTEGFVKPPEEPSRELFDSDPIGYMEAKMQYDEGMKAFNEQQAQLRQQQAYVQQMQAQEQQARLTQEMEKLTEKIPEFKDPEKAGKFKEDLVKTANEFYGYAPEDLQGVTDHRALMVLADAMRWRKSQANKSKAEQKASKARPVIKPQAKRTADPKRKQVQQSKSKLKKSGSVDDALALMFK
jgi:uncharacterized phage infection (PIP) family protein YhgE